MTFPLAFVTPDFGLVSNDTRVRNSTIGGTLLSHHDRGRKLLPLDGAWITGGSSETLAAWAAHYLLEGRPIDPDALRERLAGIVPLRANPGHHQGLFVVQRDPDGFACYYLDLTARNFSRRTGLPIDGGIPFADGRPEVESRCNALIRAMETALGGTPRIPDALRALGALYVTVYALLGPSGSISSELEFGVLLPAPDGGVDQRQLGPLSAAAIAHASDAQLEALLLPVNPLAPARC